MFYSKDDRDKQDIQDLRAVLNTKEGARFLSALIEMCGVYRTSYSGEETNAMIFKEGARNIGLAVFEALEFVDDNARSKLAQADKERTVVDINEREK